MAQTKERPDWWPRGTPCPVCGQPTAKAVRTCSRVCMVAWKIAQRPPARPCPVCGTPIPSRGDKARNVACSRSCGQVLNARERDPEVEAERRRKIAKRMRVVRTEIPNPMHDPEVRRRVSESHRASGHAPKQRGGNGTGPTKTEAALFEALTALSGPGVWQLGYVVSPGAGRRRGGNPTHWKIDLAAPSLRWAVEVDGSSHSTLARQEQDRRKTASLESLGWQVRRVSNGEVLADAAGAARRILSELADAEVVTRGPVEVGR